MFPIIVGLNYRTAPIEIRERMSIHHSQITSALQRLKAYRVIEGTVLLSTCNRFEIYAVTKDTEAGIDSIKDFLSELTGDEREEFDQYLYIHSINSAFRHLFRVAAGLDSMVLGESEILGQVGRAYKNACSAGTANKIINVMFQKSLAAGKKVRAQTGIDRYSTSISYIAVELAKQRIDSFHAKKIMILGAGEMGVLTMKHVAAQGVSTLMVSNRSFKRAQQAAVTYQGQAVSFADLESCLTEVDVVFSATSSTSFILGKQQMQAIMERRQTKPLVLIDIAVPRDIHPEVRTIKGISLYDIDDLRSVADFHQNAKELAAKKAEKIIAQEIKDFQKWYNSLYVLPTISALQKRTEEIKEKQLDQALAKLGEINPKQEKIIRSLANSIVKNLLHAPIMTLKEVSNTPQGHLYTQIIQNAFELDVDDGRMSVDVREAEMIRELLEMTAE